MYKTHSSGADGVACCMLPIAVIGTVMMGCIALLVFLLFHHPLQQWAEAEEQDGGYCRHDNEDEEEVV